MNTTALTVSQLNLYIKSLLDGDSRLSSIFVVGEISNFTNHYRSGHFYFSMKDNRCAVKCVMFAGHASRVRFRPEDGMRVLVRGRVSVYEVGGQYQLYVEDMQPDGVGALNLAFEQLKEKLAREGLFDIEKKKPVPQFPGKIGVITSPVGAAVQDIKHILSRRFPMAQVVLCPVLVQGEEAPAQIIEAIRRFNQLDAADVLIVGRGGGSIEELWAFNDEGLAREVAASHIPIISAVGHETDFTICDFVADLRAPTPSAAAELAVPDQEEVKQHLCSYRRKMKYAMDVSLHSNQLRLQRLMQSRIIRNPQELIEKRRMHLDYIQAALSRLFSDRLSGEQKRFAEIMAKLDALNPMKVLARGYAVAQDSQGNVVRSIKEIEVGQNLDIQISDGQLDCIVQEKKEEFHEEAVL